MIMAEHNETGSKAEEIVSDYLAGQNIKILCRNWTFGKKEIDIIAEEKELLVIVEVKARNIKNAETPAELLTNKKMRNIVDAAEAYILEKNIEKEVRFDFALVIFAPEGHKLEYIKEAFIPGVNW